MTRSTPARIVDAHHHLWRQADLTWLTGPMQPRIFGPYEEIRRDYPLGEYLADVRTSGVVKSIYVQTNWPPGRELDEAAWIQSIGDNHGFPHGFIAYADLQSNDVETTLDALMAHRNIRGIRQQLHWHENPTYRFAADADIVNDAAWRRGLRAVGRRGLLFELQVFPGQMKNAARLTHDFPDVSFVLLHAGMLEDTSDLGWSIWRTGMASLAACANVSVKLSGLGTFTHRCNVEEWAPVIRETVAMFGSQRCLFGSNFPIEKLWTGYSPLVEAVADALSTLTAPERDAVFYGNAIRTYRI
jgi:predicted TIM-barrel fold metal-dependent hydrolase